LKPGGRAAVVLPDNVLFESNVGVDIRRDLMDKCNLHTILRLPSGIFYAQGVKTNVLFFTRGVTHKKNTKEVWVYDLRADMAVFGKRNGLARDHFAEFEQAFGDDPTGSPSSLKKRRENHPEGRWRRFTRKQVAEHGDSLDFAWLTEKKAYASGGDNSATQLTQYAVHELESALDDLTRILAELGDMFHEKADR
jgi:type I restriction enzyme M protein